jgi:alginate O-acetyltransferase complex protein AlgI
VLFNSLEFVAFLALVVCGYALCPSGWRQGYLLLASYVFYFTWSVPFAVLLLALTGVAFVLAKQIGAAADEASRRRYLAVGVVLLFAPLAVFKYLGVVAATIVGLVHQSGWSGDLAGVRFAGAVGLSYYTFKLVGYLIDVSWERMEPCRQFSALATYAAFFPQILSGPIQRAGSLLGQLKELRPAGAEMIASGLRLLLFGFFKKLVVADRLGVVVDQVFAHPEQFSGGVLALGSYLFAVQLYADFSGLTDIAIGTARLFGISSPRNFDSPFYAENIQEFWRRWHMTLTGWLSDYLFTPLRMASRGWGQAGLVASIVINMVAIGMWHGAAWTFAVFGLIHATYMVLSSLTMRQRKRWLARRHGWQCVHAVLGPLITFNMVVVSLVFFRAASVTDAWYVVHAAAAGLVTAAVGCGPRGANTLGWHHLHWAAGDVVVVMGALVIMEGVHLLQRRRLLSRVVKETPGWLRWAVYYALGFAILLWGESGSQQFIYVRF